MPHATSPRPWPGLALAATQVGVMSGAEDVLLLETRAAGSAEANVATATAVAMRSPFCLRRRDPTGALAEAWVDRQHDVAAAHQVRCR